MRSAAIVLTLLCLAGSAAAQDAWTHAGKGPARLAVADALALPDLTSPAWTYDGQGAFEAISQATPVISQDGIVIVLGMLDDQAHAIALEARTGEERWRTPIDAPVFSSWSSPALLGTADEGVVIVASGAAVAALNLGDGSQSWRTPLGQSVVNASPAIDAARGVVRLSTYEPFGGSARLITLDMAAGDIVLEPTIGSASGATPALDGDRAFVALTDGAIGAYDDDTQAWSAMLPTGFFGGVVYHDGAIYAASYAFSGGRDNSSLVKLDARTGDVLWTVPAERTSSMPIVLDDRVVLAGGLQGFGSLPTVQLYEDTGASAARRWDLASASWNDLNGNGAIDPGEFLALGRWDHQPLALRTGDDVALLVGSPTGGLALLDLDADPSSEDIVIATTDLGGGSPAIASGVAVSMWADHVAGFATGPDCFADFDGDGALTLFDFLAFQNAFDGGSLQADCDGDASLTLFDFLCFQNAFDAGCG